MSQTGPDLEVTHTHMSTNFSSAQKVQIDLWINVGSPKVLQSLINCYETADPVQNIFDGNN